MIVAIIQARMQATRLPGKVLKRVDGATLLGYQVARVRKSKRLNKVVVATTTAQDDDQIATFCQENAIEYFRGSENDVLSRYHECALQYQADIIVRLTADCPFSDPEVIDKCIDLFLNKKVDYVGNTIPPQTSTYPDGFDVEVFSWDALQKANSLAKQPQDREHVTFYFWKYDNGFKTAQLNNKRDYSKYRLTVDYPDDFEVAEFVMRELKKSSRFGSMDEIIKILDVNPVIRQKNSKHYFGIGWNK